MGIRVHKILGWGLTDLEKDYEADPRVNWASPLLPGGDKTPTAGDYWSWLEKRREAAGKKFPFSLDWAMLRHDEKLREKDLYGCVVYEHEYGLPEVLVIRPATKDDWSRFDDTIDYMEETYPWSRGSQQNRVQVYEHGPFPFNGSYMDKRTGKLVPEKVMYWIRARSNVQQAPGDTIAERLGMLNALAQEFTPFETHAEADENIVPQVPDEIRDLAEFGQLFTHAGTWRQLRPLLYTYWA
jgi:hypothetical protein